ncbi:ABC transporter ATP-binding protein [Candidatus Peregrinibacteria bacterium]|nr:ABC transporter ATP-binding protein [Candidatus Peregrinibacteria bacterium]
MVIIEVQNLFKQFIIPHERRDSIKEHFVNIFKSRKYESFNAIDDLSFEINEGEFFGIIGRNGSGKSTLLKMLAGIYPATKGSIKVRGRVAPFLELGVGFNPELSGKENVYLNGAILGLTEKQIKKRYEDIVQFAELERFMDQKLKNYSSGMHVRLAFSIAMQAGADILLLDEVLAVGDADFQRKCFEKFREFKKAGKTVVFVTHDLTTVRQFCDRVLYIKGGKKVNIGSVHEMIDQYIYGDRTGTITSAQSPAVIAEVKVDQGQPQSRVPGPAQSVNDGDKEVQITKVEYLDHKGVNNEKFVSGDSMTIRIHYKKNTNVDSVVCGIAVYKDDGYHLYGTNSLLQNKAIKLKNSGAVDFRTEKLNLLAGDYALTIAFHGEDGKPYDWRDKEFYFTVIKNNNDDGVVSLNYQFHA